LQQPHSSAPFEAPAAMQQAMATRGRGRALPGQRSGMRVAAALASTAMISRMSGGAFSVTRLKRPDPMPQQDAGVAPTADAWIEAARRMAAGRSDAAAHMEAAWHGTEAWWLRPFAQVVAIALGVGAGIPRRLAEVGDAVRATAVKVIAPRAARPAVPGKTGKQRKAYLSEADGPAAVGALRQLELPFFATSSTWVNRPARGLVLRGRFRPSLQDRLLEAEAETRSNLEAHLGRELGRVVRVHLLRDSSQEEEQGTSCYELFVTEQPSAASGEGALMYFLMSLAVVLAFCSQLGSPFLAKVAGPGAAPLAPGSELPLGLLFGLLALGEATKAAVSRSFGGSWTPPVLLPSPQLGLMGAFPCGKEAPHGSRTAALLAALAGPLAMAAGSVLLLAYSALFGPAADITLETPLGIAWPLALLPQHCSAAFWAGVHGLLMAGLLLLPHSPAGQAAWQSIVGRKAADKASDFAAYFYPLLGIICSTSTGPGWFVLPLWWAILIVNVASPETQPPLEEVSEVPAALRNTAGAVLCSAAIALVPLPLFDLLQPLASLP